MKKNGPKPAQLILIEIAGFHSLSWKENISQIEG